MNKTSYTNLAKMWEFVENRARSEQSQAAAELRRQAETSGIAQGSAAQASLLKLLVRLTHSTSLIAIGTGSLVETQQLVDGLEGRGQLTAVDSSSRGVAMIRNLFASLDEHTQTTLRAVNAPADVFLARLNAGAYQFMVVSGDASNYDAAFRQAPRLLADAGIIAFTDVMAMDGPDANGGLVNPADRSEKAVAMRELLDTVQSDERFVSTLVSCGTGMLLAVKR